MADWRDLLKFRGDRSSGAGLYQLLLGENMDTLANEGLREYPEEGAGSAHHRRAARLATQRSGGNVLLTQLGGLGVEGLEALGGGMKNPNWLQDTGRDLRANWRGSMDAVKDEMAKNPAAAYFIRGLFGR